MLICKYMYVYGLACLEFYMYIVIVFIINGPKFKQHRKISKSKIIKL